MLKLLTALLDPPLFSSDQWAPQLYDALLQGMLDALSRLDLTYTHDATQEAAQQLVPCTPADMHAFINLERLATALVSACGAQRFRYTLFVCDTHATISTTPSMR